MGRELLLLRHGKSDRGAATDDFHRPLKDRGKRGAQRIGVWLLQQGLIPDLILSSPAERALTTAEKCCKAAGLGAERVQQDQRIYLADLDALLAVLADCPAGVERVMLVGHNPGLEDLLRHLADEAPQTLPDGKLMPTATLARLALTDDWAALKEGRSRLLQLVRSSDLPSRFPYPPPDGDEWRDRPAYYYTQSSVLPYRVREGQVEILIIRSSGDKHWVVPKGIADPGHSLQSSAAKEAWEEAGVEGEVSGESLGSYSYPKWGSRCTVTVFPMEVRHLVAEEAWQERHRGRQWVSAQAAAVMLRQPALRPMVLALEQRLTRCRD